MLQRRELLGMLLVSSLMNACAPRGGDGPTASVSADETVVENIQLQVKVENASAFRTESIKLFVAARYVATTDRLYCRSMDEGGAWRSPLYEGQEMILKASASDKMFTAEIPTSYMGRFGRCKFELYGNSLAGLNIGLTSDTLLRRVKKDGLHHPTPISIVASETAELPGQGVEQSVQCQMIMVAGAPTFPCQAAGPVGGRSSEPLLFDAKGSTGVIKISVR